MQELKEKIANRAVSGKGKNALNKYSLQNLSISFKNVRNSYSFDKCEESRASSNSRFKKSKGKLWKTFVLDQSKASEEVSPAKLKVSEGEKVAKKISSKIEDKKAKEESKRKL